MTAPFNRSELMKRLVAGLKHDEAVIAGIGNTNFDVYMAGHRPQNFYMLGSMGLACPIALGVAMAQPDRGVIAVEGDGSILMNLSCFGTIAKMKPKNLTIIILDNGTYQITGNQPTVTKDVADIVAIAKGSGIANSAWASTNAEFDKLVAPPFNTSGPRLIAAKIDDKPAVGQTPRDPALIRNRFMKGLGTSRAGALDA